MVVRVATKDVESAKHLVVDFVELFGGEQVSLQADGEVELQLRGAGNGALAQTLTAVERWLGQASIASADVWVDERSYTVEQAGSSRSRVPSGVPAKRPVPSR
jgi:hypothetical protein